MKKVIGSIIVILLLSVMGIGMTSAWFIAGTSTKENIFNTGKVDIQLNEEFNPPSKWVEGEVIPKIIEIENEGSLDVYTRIRLTGVWQQRIEGDWVDTSLAPDNVELTMAEESESGWIYDNGFYYYKNILPANETSSPLRVDAKLKSGAQEYDGKRFMLKVVAEAVQTSNGAYKDVWDIEELPPGVQAWIGQ